MNYWHPLSMKCAWLAQNEITRHYDDVLMGAIASQITSLTFVYSTVYSDADQRKHQRSASLAFVRGIHRGPVNSPHKWPVTRKMFPFDDVIMDYQDIEAETKWPPFRRRPFQKHFLDWKCMNLESNIPDVCSEGFNWQYSSISSDNGLAPTRRQVIIWTNDG